MTSKMITAEARVFECKTDTMRTTALLRLFTFSLLVIGSLPAQSSKPTSKPTVATAPISKINEDEHLILFAGYGYQADKQWHCPVHAWVFEPEADALVRRALLKLIELNTDLSAEEADTELFRQRAAMFLVDNERNKEVVVSMGSSAHSLPKTEANGHAQAKLTIPINGQAAGWIDYQTKGPKGRRFIGGIQLIGPKGLSVISDLDDTIKVSGVTSKEELLKNTFLREFKAVDGMAAAYKRLQNQGAAFHYLSSSPWQLYPALHEFIGKQGFPAGSFALKTFRMKDSSFLSLFQSAEEHKLPLIREILSKYPQRQFLLIGDSGEKDLEIYLTIAQELPKQVQHIFIRELAEAPVGKERRAAVSKDMQKRLTIFRDPAKLAWPR